MTKHQQQGFTLIELMIVVAILGILAATSISQYRNYVTRSQVARVMNEAGTLRVAVEACLLDGKAAGACSISWSTSNLIGADATVSNTGQEGLTINYPDDVSIVARFGANASTMIKGQTLTWGRTALLLTRLRQTPTAISASTWLFPVRSPAHMLYLTAVRA